MSWIELVVSGVGIALLALYVGVVVRSIGDRDRKFWNTVASRLGTCVGSNRGTLEGLPIRIQWTAGDHEDIECEVGLPGMPGSRVLELVRDRLGLGTGGRDIRLVPGGLGQTCRTNDPVVLADSVLALVAAAKGLLARDISALLAENVRTSRDMRIQLESLEALVEHFPSSEDTARALDSALRDDDAEVRHRAALETSLGRVLDVVIDPATSPEVRKEALEHLARKLPYSKIAHALGAVLEAPGDEPRRCAVNLIAGARDASYQERLADLAEEGAPAGYEYELFRALEALGPVPERALIGFLRSRFSQLRQRAAEQLKLGGTARAVEPLLECEKNFDPWARSAIDAIQRRLGGGEVGSLSVVDHATAEGAVSLAVSEREKG